MASTPTSTRIGVIPEQLDPITFEVLANAFTSVIDEMGIMLEKVSFSTVTSEARDYSCSIGNGKGDVVARGAGDLPLLGATGTFRFGAVIDGIPHEQFAPGDVILHNDPYMGGTHIQDVSAIMPVFWEDELVYFVQITSHWADLGGPVPGSFNSDATTVFAEGLLIPPVHVMRAGEWDRSVERLILRNVRIPEVIRGDLRGLVEAARVGARQLLALVQKYGADVVQAASDGFITYSESLLRHEFKQLPDGTVSWEDHIDGDPITGFDHPIQVGLDVTIAGDGATFDYTRTDPAGIGPVNCTKAVAVGASVSAIKAVFPHVPLNDGFLRAIEFVLPDGAVINADYPRPVGGMAANAAEKVLSCVHGCFIQIAPERAMACPTNLVNITLSGIDNRPGRGGEFVMYLWLAGGWGARPAAGDNHTFLMPLAAGTRLQFAEVLERVYPALIEGYGLKPDSEGAGKYRGGFGLSSPFHMTHGDALINTQGDRELILGWGHDGGEGALGNKLIYAPGSPEEQSIGVMRAGFPIHQGVTTDYWQGGGGGVGDPLTRDVNAVIRDVRNGLVSLGRAADVYGVVLNLVDEDLLEYEVDEEATAARRAGVVS